VLVLDHIHLAYDTAQGPRHVVRDLSLTLETGKIGCLLGASGCGKSTILRAIAGFEPLRQGEIRLAGATLSTAAHRLAPERRAVGMMFQDYALFPHLSVAQNIAFGLHRASRAERKARVQALLATVDLSGAHDRYPHELSGGQQQRVALARALAPDPDLLLLDEPFSNLDIDMRERLAFEVRDILTASGHTALLVTHNQAEAFAIADRIGVMHEGEILQWDTPHTVHHHPAHPFVAQFVGREHVLQRREQALSRGQ